MDLDQVEGPVRKDSISSSPQKAVIGIATVLVCMPHLSFHEVGVDILLKLQTIAVTVTIVEAITVVLRGVEKVEAVVADSIMGTMIHIACLMVMGILLPLHHICTAMVILVILIHVMGIHTDMGTVQLIILLRMECMVTEATAILPLEHPTIHPTTIVMVHLRPYLSQSTTMPIKCPKRNVARWTTLANPRNRPRHLDEKRCTVIMSV